MPAATLRYCNEPSGRCPNKVPRGRCASCQKKAQQGYEQARGTRQERGYDRAWYAWRDSIIKTYGLALCGDRPPSAPATKDSLCVQQGMYVKGDDLDHIQPINGLEDPRRFDESNVQLLCDRPPNYCHSKKRGRERWQGR